MLAKKITLFFIKAYQLILSPDQGLFRRPIRVCRFSPSCSQYAYQAIDKYGFLKGAWLGVKRIGRCHPWREGGYDPVN